MQRFMYKQRGAISIFLAIILIPMMMIASIYIDSSRIKLAQSVASSAGDLTLNTAMTNYDNILKDMYGLFAVSQTEDELMDNLQDYYKKSLTSAGLSEKDANTYVGKIMSQLGMVAETGDVSDLLNIELDDSKDIVSTDETTSLANPYMLKKQIVEFMKYRFGIGVGMSFISSLKSFDSLAEQMDVIDKRTEYYEEQKTVIEWCETAWKNIVEYNDLKTNVKYFEDLKTELLKDKNNYSYITQNFVKDYYNAADRPTNSKNYFSEESTLIIKKESDNTYGLYTSGTKYTDFGTYSDTTPATETQLDKFSSDFCSSIQSFTNKSKSDDYSEIFMTGSGAGIYEVQRVIQFNRLAETDDNICKDAKNFYVSYNKLIKGIESVNKSITYYTELKSKLEKRNNELKHNISVNNGIISADNLLLPAAKANLQLYDKILEILSSITTTSGNIEKKYNDYIAELKKNSPEIYNLIKSELEEVVDNKVIKLVEKVKKALTDTTAKKVITDRRKELVTQITETEKIIKQLKEDNEKYQKEIDANIIKIDEYKVKIQELQALLKKQVPYYNTTKTYQGIVDDKKSDYEKQCLIYSNVVSRMIETINKTDVSKKFINDTNLSQSNKQWVAGTKSNEEIIRIYETIKKYHDTLTSASGYLKVASDNLAKVIESLSVGGDLNNARETWKGTSSNSKIEGTVISEQNLEEVETVKEFMDVDEVKELKTRVDGTKSTIDKILGEVESYTYADEKLYDISDISKLVETVNNCSTKFELLKVELKETELNKSVTKIYKAYMKFPSQIMSKPWENESTDWIHSVNPVMNTAGGECKFYQYLKKNFPDVEANGAEKVKDTKQEDTDVGKSEDALEKTGEDAKKQELPAGTAKQEFNATDLPSEYWSSDLLEEVKEINAEAGNGDAGIQKLESPDSDGFIASLSTLFSKIGSMISDFAVDFRDNIYISDYILSMFSYDTYEKEIIYNILKEKDGVKSQSLSYVLQNAASGSLYTEGAEGKPYTFNNSYKYATEFQTEAKTLTNVPISPNNNDAYLSEAEYIIYGSNGTTDTYATIYGIRVAFNTIYAFTDSEIREGAYSIALAVFGTPPLTFLVPIAQAAIVIAVALGESGIDLAMLKAGMDVPLFKTSDTWVLKFSSILSSLTSEAVDYATEQAKTATEQIVNKGVSSLNSWLDKTNEEVDEWLNEKQGDIISLTNSVSGGLDEAITRYTDAAINQLVNICQVAESLTDSSGKIDGVAEVEYIKNKLTEWLSGEAAGIDAGKLANDIGYIAKEAAVKRIIENNQYISGLLVTIRRGANVASDKIKETSETIQKDIKKMRDQISKFVMNSNEKIKAYKDDTVAKVKDAASKGGEELKKALNSSIDGISGSVKDSLADESKELVINKDNNTAASFCSFSYSDYLRLFLVIGLTFNQEDILLRTADVIQANVKLKDDDETKFFMKNAYTYININATLRVKPLMMTMPFMKDVTDSHLSGDGWYTIKYKGILGY